MVVFCPFRTLKDYYLLSRTLVSLSDANLKHSDSRMVSNHRSRPYIYDSSNLVEKILLSMDLVQVDRWLNFVSLPVAKVYQLKLLADPTWTYVLVESACGGVCMRTRWVNIFQLNRKSVRQRYFCFTQLSASGGLLAPNACLRKAGWITTPFCCFLRW
jgi:hypothetical protein